MDARIRSIRARRGPSLTSPTLPLLLAVVALLSACTAGGASPSIPPGATGTTAPAATATAAPSAPSASAEPSPSDAAFPLTVTDDEGTDVTIPTAPQRIVSLTPAATETLFALGAGERVVGKVEDIGNHPPEAADIPVVATFSGVDVEQIVALEADLVIAGGNGGTPPDAIERLRSLDIPVVVLYAADVDGVFRDIELTGDIAGAGDAARDLAASMRAGFGQVEAATADLERPRVFYETGDQPAIYGVADDSFVASMIELAGGEPITTGSATVWEQSVEELVSADPELILLGDAAYGVTADAVEARPGWAGMTAVREGEIRPIDDIVVTRPGPRLLEGLHQLASAIHPDVTLPAVSPAASAAP